MTKAKKQTKRRKGQSGSKAMLNVIANNMIRFYLQNHLMCHHRMDRDCDRCMKRLMRKGIMKSLESNIAPAQQSWRTK